MFKFIMKIWKDPVWSKIIAGFIGIGISSIPIVIWWNTIIIFFKKQLIPFVSDHILIITLCFLLIFIIVQNIVIFYKKHKKGLKWIKKCLLEEDSSISPLFWFPLNGVLKTSATRSDYKILKKISDSRLVKKWKDKNAITEQWGYGTIYYSITKEVYDFMDEKIRKILKEGTEDTDKMKAFKETPFELVVLGMIDHSTKII